MLIKTFYKVILVFWVLFLLVFMAFVNQFNNKLMSVENSLFKIIELNSIVYDVSVYNMHEKSVTIQDKWYVKQNEISLIIDELLQDENNEEKVLLDTLKTYNKNIVEANLSDFNDTLIEIRKIKVLQLNSLRSQMKTLTIYMISLILVTLFVSLFYIWKNIIKPINIIYTHLKDEDNLLTIDTIQYTINNEFSLIINALNNSINSTKLSFQKDTEHKKELEIKNLQLVQLNKEIAKMNDHLEDKVEKRTQELKILNAQLQQQVELKTNENLKQLQILQHQSKLAAMGEMIGAIAHQWRQPLNELSIRIQRLPKIYEKDEMNKEFLDEFVEKNKKTIFFMSKTIDDFRNFFRIDKNKKLFNIKDAIEETIEIQSAQLKNHNIIVNIIGDGFKIDGFKTEFQQVILNIISNAKDVFMQRDIKIGIVDIELQDFKVFLTDNGGGIEENVMQRLFEPYFTTKPQGEGTGLGLYMSKMIIENNMNGKLYAKNIISGAQFIIDFRKLKEKENE